MTPARTEALAVLAECARLGPDIRLGQMLAMLDVLAQSELGRGFWEIEDEELLGLVRQHREDLGKRMPDLSEVA
jgi:hypothetical protein